MKLHIFSVLITSYTLRLHAKFQPPSFKTEVGISHKAMTSMASEAVEAKHSVVHMSQGYMQSFNLLALKLRMCIKSLSNGLDELGSIRILDYVQGVPTSLE
mgnify:CR=1 FL=1